MLVDDKARAIGKVVALNTDRISIELLKDLDNFTLNGFDDIHYVGQLNSYVVIPYLNYYIVGEVSSIREKDNGVFAYNTKDQELQKYLSTKLIDIVPFGTLRQIANKKLEFSFGVSVYPGLYSDVLYIKDNELDSIYNSQDTEVTIEDGFTRISHLSLGTSTIFKDYQVKIDIDKFFGSHSAVLGNTGSGKSCTITALLQGVYDKSNYSAIGSSFIVFDVNGEYEQALGDIKNDDINTVIVKSSAQNNDFKVPHWFFNLDEWELLLNTSEKTQRPVLHTALGLSGYFETCDDDKSVNHIVSLCALNLLLTTESPVAAGHKAAALFTNYGRGTISGDVLKHYGFNYQYGNFDQRNINGGRDAYVTYLTSLLLKDFEMPKYTNIPFKLSRLVQFIDLAIIYEEAHGNRQIRDYCSSMITRAKNVIDHPSFNFVNEDPNKAISQSNYLQNILGLEKQGDGFKKKSQLYILDLNESDDDAVEIISTVLSRIIFDALKKAEPRNSFPVNLLMEEAHRYISNNNPRDFSRGNNIFERIAKEGRKYGLFLLVSSQRPSELSKTVLSQCSNFIVHRIQNPEDLQHIKQITPHISETLLKRLPSVPKQHALVFGACVSIPSLIKINNVDPRPKSDDNKISENWFINKNQDITINFN